MDQQIIHGSAHSLPMISDKSVHCVVTSPPYYNLRQYSGDQAIEWPAVDYSPMPGLSALHIPGCDPDCEHKWVETNYYTTQGAGRSSKEAFSDPGQSNAERIKEARWRTNTTCIHCEGWRGPLGLEPTIEAYIGHLMLVMRELWRVLRDDGTVWWVIGDSYAGSGGAHAPNHANPGLSKSAQRDGVMPHFGQLGMPERYKAPNGLKPKDMMLIPARFALAAQAEGWWVRSAITWIKGNPMTESVQDRPTRATEQIFLLSKSKKYFYDIDAIRVPHTSASLYRWRNGGENTDNTKYPKDEFETKIGNLRNGSNPLHISGRNLWDWWHINTKGYAGAHFAIFPDKIPEIAISAGTSARGVCSTCGAPWKRVVESTGEWRAQHDNEQKHDGTIYRKNPGGGLTGPNTDRQVVEHGWQATCDCGHTNTVSATVLDPFLGSGTTAKVALALGRRVIGVDLSREYLDKLVPERTGNVQIKMTF